MNTILGWGVIGAIVMVGGWTLLHLTGTIVPAGFEHMRPVALSGAGFFWGSLLFLIKKRIRHG